METRPVMTPRESCLRPLLRLLCPWRSSWYNALEGAVNALDTMFTRPYPLIEAFVAQRVKAGFFAPNVNQFRAPFLGLKPLNSDLLHAIVDFEGFGFVGMAFLHLALGISGAVTTRCGASSSRIAPKFLADGRRMYPDLLGDFFLTTSGLKEGHIMIPLFKLSWV